jgi:hypothetical protein
METMRDLRRRIAVEEGFLVNYDDVVDIPEEKVGIVRLTPLGLQVVASTARGIENYDANAFSDLPNYERTANVIELRTDLRPKGFGVGAWTGTPYISAKKTYIIAQPSNYSGMYGYVFPQIGTAIGGASYYPAVNCAYVPSGGPWGFSSSVYDSNLERVFTTDPLVPAITNVFGSDFWINKWGGKGGVDASVRILGNQIRQYKAMVLLMMYSKTGTTLQWLVWLLGTLKFLLHQPSKPILQTLGGVQPLILIFLITQGLTFITT